MILERWRYVEGQGWNVDLMETKEYPMETKELLKGGDEISDCGPINVGNLLKKSDAELMRLAEVGVTRGDITYFLPMFNMDGRLDKYRENYWGQMKC